MTHFSITFSILTILQKRSYTTKANILIKMPRDPDARFIFKILYEIIAINGLLRYKHIVVPLRRFISINKADQKNRIIINNGISKYVISNTSNTFREFKQFEMIPFKEWHAFIPRISKGLILYFELILFGQIRNFLIVGRWNPKNDSLNSFYNEALVFSYKNKNFFRQTYTDLESKDHILWADAAVDIRFWEIETKSGRETV
jgi:hypothetical protein